ncbi:hypothetical protein N7478_007724 [Penicillium angulare]|uniref:uncharacterized protein n=1 Tax=Penicillium angulare TaxID=116970 RepID=UPI00253FBC17|nr:uncharacterized protein N7478_007724 [Penicillium angulare]KAJ5272599.1 hypothetical protein N7478_007724 [Penicillium angulare]
MAWPWAPCPWAAHCTGLIRTEEKSFWNHESLEILLGREFGAYSGETSSSEIEGEAKDINLEYIERWQGGIEAESDWEDLSSN